MSVAEAVDEARQMEGKSPLYNRLHGQWGDSSHLNTPLVQQKIFIKAEEIAKLLKVHLPSIDPHQTR